MDIHIFLFFVDVMVNFNKAWGMPEVKRVITEWEVPRGKFRVEWEVTDKKTYWRVEGSNGEFFPIRKEEAPEFEDVVEILKHIYDEDVTKEWKEHGDDKDKGGNQ